VLAVCASCPPNNRTGLIIDTLTIFRNGFSVGLHIALLEVISKFMQVLVVRKKGVSLGAVEIIVPNPNDCHDNRQIVLQRSLLEVFIHAVCTLEQLLEIVIPHVQRD